MTSSVTYVLSANVENLTLTGTAAINGTGNELNNVLTGNAANNVLDGGVGEDRLYGGAGDDTYLVDASGDYAIENANEGTDTVMSSTGFRLGANVENLILTGTAASYGEGNALNNVLTGNAANNRLDGREGADRMDGGTGNDIYVVDNVGDVVVESSTGGTDTVVSSIAYTLGANLENLFLVGAAGLSGTGNELNNVLTGNVASNVLSGGVGDDTVDGGAGGDFLYGGLGDDTYVVDSTDDVVIEYAQEGTDTGSPASLTRWEPTLRTLRYWVRRPSMARAMN